MRSFFCNFDRTIVGAEERNIRHDPDRLVFALKHVLWIVLFGKFKLSAFLVVVNAFDDLLNRVTLAERSETNEAFRADVFDLCVLAAFVDDETHLGHRVDELLFCDGALNRKIYRRANTASECRYAFLFGSPFRVVHTFVFRVGDNRKTVLFTEPVRFLTHQAIGFFAVVVLHSRFDGYRVNDEMVVKASGIAVSGNDYLVVSPEFLCEFYADLVSRVRIDFAGSK